MRTKDWFLSGIGLIGYVVWAVIAYVDAAQRTEFLHFTILAVTTSAAIVIRDMQPVKKDGGDGAA